MTAAATSAEHHDNHDERDDVVYPQTAAFVLVHLACLGAFFTGVPTKALWLAFALYWIRMFSATAGYHRYFAHRSFKTSRVGQFLLAILAQMGAARGVIWWASTHRHHHLYSDQPEDVHSPRQKGFWWAHVGWIFSNRADETKYELVPDLMKVPELVWLNKYPNVPAAVLATASFLWMGPAGLIVGFFWSTVALYHGTFMINSMAHVLGRRRYVTGDDSRNNWFLALVTMGEGWHNNHHHYQRSCRQGFRWYEVDMTFYILRAASWLGLVWDLGAPPEEVVANERPLGRKTLEKVARQLAESVPVERLRAQAREAWAHHPTFADARASVEAFWTQHRAEFAEFAERTRDSIAHHPRFAEWEARSAELRAELAAKVAEFEMPHFPTREELRQRADRMFAKSPSMDDVVARAREIIAESVSLELALTPA
ncbi:MAG: fatty acid desaturase [Gemmatimonadaceae bacterium]|nr:fatty acid desaturase [Gemmatimonadaceae bacterium]